MPDPRTQKIENVPPGTIFHFQIEIAILMFFRIKFGLFRLEIFLKMVPSLSINAWFMLRYDISELWETGGGAEMWAAEAVERNWSVSLHRVKTWPQLMCCALV